MSDLTAFDIGYKGINDLGDLIELQNEEAFINSLRLWMASFSGERMFQPQKGGYLMQLLCKPMKDIVPSQVDAAIRMGLSIDFSPSVNVNYITVIPDYEKRFWNITVSVYVPDFKKNIELNDKIKGK